MNPAHKFELQVLNLCVCKGRRKRRSLRDESRGVGGGRGGRWGRRCLDLLCTWHGVGYPGQVESQISAHSNYYLVTFFFPLW